MEREALKRFLTQNSPASGQHYFDEDPEGRGLRIWEKKQDSDRCLSRRVHKALGLSLRCVLGKVMSKYGVEWMSDVSNSLPIQGRYHGLVEARGIHTSS